MTSPLRSLWDAPAAVPPPPRRVWRDWALVAVLPLVVLFEAAVRPDDVPWRWLWAGVLIALVPTLLWRRTHPLLMLAIAFGVGSIVTVVTGGDPQLVTTAYFLLLVYAVVRWGSGRAMLAAGAILLASSVALVRARPDHDRRRRGRPRGRGHDRHPRGGVPLAGRGAGSRARPGQAARTRAARPRPPRHRRASRVRDRDPGPGGNRRGGHGSRCRGRGAAGHRGRGVPHARRDALDGPGAPPRRRRRPGAESGTRRTASARDHGCRRSRRRRPHRRRRRGRAADGRIGGVPARAGGRHERPSARPQRDPGRRARRRRRRGDPSRRARRRRRPRHPRPPATASPG